MNEKISSFNNPLHSIFIKDNKNTITSEIDWLDFWRLWPEYPDPHMTFPGPVIHAGFYINMNKKLMIIFDDKAKKEIKRSNFNEKLNSICPIIQFKHHVSVSVGSKAFKGRSSFIKNI